MLPLIAPQSGELIKDSSTKEKKKKGKHGSSRVHSLDLKMSKQFLRNNIFLTIRFNPFPTTPYTLFNHSV